MALRGIESAVRLFFSITSANACEAAGGRFVPGEAGWMTHVYMFAGDDPKLIWDADDVGSMGNMKHMREPPTGPRP